MSAEDRRDLLATIEEEATRLTRFVANMLDMTRIEAGVIDVRKEEVAVGEMLRAAVDRASKLLRRRKSKLIVDSNLPLILGDAAVLEQIMFNLLDNADKYSGSASVTEVAARARPDGVAITVTDHGAGIAADALPHIFDKFYRANPGDGRPPGTGLGLSICKGLVEAMGGHIAAQSPVAAGRGTRITLTFPGAPKRRGSGLTDEAEA
jgi:two-component system sensor histidine kinase KdpD